MTGRAGGYDTRPSNPHSTRTRLRVIEFSPILAALLLVGVWLGVPPQLREAMMQWGTWRTSATRLTFVQSAVPTGAMSEAPVPAPATSARLATARNYYAALRTLRWEKGSPATEFRVVARRVADSVGRRTGAFYRSDGSPKPVALGADDPAYAPLRSWAASWGATAYIFLLPDPPEPSVVASAVARSEWLATPDELASLHATDTPDYLWKLRHPGQHPAFVELSGGSEEAFVSGLPRALSYDVDEVAGEFWLSIRMLPGGVWLEEPGGGYWSSTVWSSPPSITSIAATISPAAIEFQSRLERVAANYHANLWVLGPLALRAVPQLVPKGVTNDRAARFGEAVLRSSAAPGGGEVLNDELSEMSPTEQALASGERFQVLAQVTGTSASLSTSETPQTMLLVATWPQDPYPPLHVSHLATAWDELRAWVAAGQRAVLVACFVLLGAALVASPVAYVADRRATERERIGAEMARVQRDAHDRVYNRMAALSMRLEAESSTTSDRESSAALAVVAAELADTRRDLREILGDARATAADRATRVADTSSLVADQLAALVTAQRSVTGVEVEFQAEPNLPPIAPEAGWDLQCIAEEAISNAVRHGRASIVIVTLGKDPGNLRLEIADNGRSTEPIDIDRLPATSTGLRGMRARAERLGGSLELSWAQNGVRVIVRIPERPGWRVG